jgi:hypothetical protein
MAGPFDPGGNVDQAANTAKRVAIGAGQAAQPYLTRQIGTALGGLNSIGALRSGAVPVAMQDIATDYGRQIGAAGERAAGESLGAGLGASELDLEKQRLAQQRKSSLLGAIGGLLGTGLGFAIGGPAGAAVGGGLAKKATGGGSIPQVI